ncbi:MAG: ribonuclease H family protein [Bacteroidales bacterium]
MATKKKYYVVWEGKETGVMENWDECKNAIHGFKGAKYKSFKTRELAEKAFRESYDNYKGKKLPEDDLTKEQLQRIGQPIKNSICVDAACSGNPGTMEYQGVEVNSGEVIFKKGPYRQANNNVGEFLALVHALALAKKNGDKRPVYSDSATAISWIRNKQHKSKLEQTEENQQIFTMLERAVIWLKNHTFDNKIIKWETKAWGEIPADFGRK